MFFRQTLLQAEQYDHGPTLSAMVRAMMANVIAAQNRSDEAETLLRDILSSDLSLGEDDIDVFRKIVIKWLARMIENQGRYAEAEGLLRQALAIEEKNGEDALSRAITVGRLGFLMVDQRKFEDAEALFRQELKLREEGGDSVHCQRPCHGGSRIRSCRPGEAERCIPDFHTGTGFTEWIRRDATIDGTPEATSG